MTNHAQPSEILGDLAAAAVLLLGITTAALAGVIGLTAAIVNYATLAAAEGHSAAAIITPLAGVSIGLIGYASLAMRAYRRLARKLAHHG